MANQTSNRRRRRGSWLECRVVAEDRDRVIRAVREVGHAIPLFTSHDVSTHLKDPKFGGLRKGSLSRHLADLEGGMLMHVDREEVRSPVGSTYRVWALRARQHELSQHLKSFGPVKDVERAFLALHVAVDVLDQPNVPTREVTAVLKNVLDLRLEYDQHTSTLLNALADRDNPPVRKISCTGERWVRWEPVQPATHPKHRQWVELCRARHDTSPATVGHAAYAEVAREIIELAIQNCSSDDYPYGRPPRIRQIPENLRDMVRGAELLRALARNDMELRALLGDVTRTRISGEKRVNPRVVRLHGPRSGRTYYDVPGSHGEAARELLPTFWDLRDAADEHAIAEILQEAHDAAYLASRYSAQASGLEAVVAIRRLLAAVELDNLAEELGDLERESHKLSNPVLKSVRKYRRRVEQAARKLPGLPSLEASARQALDPLGLDLGEVTGAERPRVFPETWTSWFTSLEQGSRSPAKHLAGSISMRRFRNPDFQSHGADEERQKCTTYVDRVEALPLGAATTRARIQGELASAARLLGRNLRHSGVIIPLLEHPERDVRRDAFFALVLLKDPAANDWINLRFGDPNAKTVEVIWALHAAVAMGGFNPQTLPAWLRDPSDSNVAEAVRSVVAAHRRNALPR